MTFKKSVLFPTLAALGFACLIGCSSSDKDEMNAADTTPATTTTATTTAPANDTTAYRDTDTESDSMNLGASSAGLAH